MKVKKRNEKQLRDKRDTRQITYARVVLLEGRAWEWEQKRTDKETSNKTKEKATKNKEKKGQHEGKRNKRNESGTKGKETGTKRNRATEKAWSG